jgi:type I restriction enzyme S subunit
MYLICGMVIRLQNLIHTFWENGTIPWFRMEDIRVNGRILSDSIQHITPSAVRGGLMPKDSIIMATSATIGEYALITVDALTNQRFICLTRKAAYFEKLDIKFFYYYCLILGKWCKDNTNVGNFASVSMDLFQNVKIPIPPLPVQQKIVSILDRFDVLVNGISEGLPAELRMRRQQYEYYRHKLLSFPERG